jgi:adenosine deaminase
MTTFSSLPKTELHLHLDCSLSYDVVSRIAPSITRDAYERDFIAPAKCTSLADFLARAPSGIALMQTGEQLRLVTEDLVDQLARDNVIYAEVRFAPHQHTERGLTPERVVAAVEAALGSASEAKGVETRLILCTLRHFTAEQSMETVRLVEQFRGTRVVALDLAADEAGFPLDAHAPAYAYAAERGLARTAHAGEARGAESVWETLERLRPSRIGHGVRSVEDPQLVEHLKANDIHLEVCPTSNVQTDVCAAMADHPVDRLYRAGVSVGINTDARTMVDVTLDDEYARLGATFGWTSEQLLACNLNAVRAAFIPDALKRALADRLVVAYGREGAP